MLFTEPIFLFYFLPVVLLFHWGLTAFRKGDSYPRLARGGIFFATLVFYGFYNPVCLIPFAFSVLCDFIWARWLFRESRPGVRKVIVFLSIVQNLGLLSLFKYWGFFVRVLGRVWPELAASVPYLFQNGDVVGGIPGISFYTFESLSFVIDVYRGQVVPPRNALDFLGFIGMFPRFVAGPIVRYRDLSQQYDNYRGMEVEKGLFLFALGFFLKCTFADSFNAFVLYAFDRGSPPEFLSAWIGVLSYTFQIYFDFSGYSLMAIGLGRMLGFHFAPNFDRPYLATSLTSFWRRWHMSLSQWLRDYLYISLGGNRRGVWRSYLNVFLTMVIGGLWCGAGTNFLVWGAWHGFFLVVERLFQLERFLPSILHRVLTGSIIVVGWIFFRVKHGIPEALGILRAMVTPFADQSNFNAEGVFAHPLLVLTCAFALVYCFWIERRVDLEQMEKFKLFIWRFRASAVCMAIIGLLLVMSNPKVPFLYFQF